ncbi:MAG: glycosyltransferase family 4 protein [Bdellovibrionales bacterium]|nr:glycosyltransferase family 4 protein [Bdellovibrionales bacterium]
MLQKKSYCFVVPRFSEEIIGGAETLVANIAARLYERGDEVLVLTTCSKDNRTWDNEYPEGDAVEFGVPVKRFKVDERDLESWIPKQISLSEGMMLSLEDQFEWMKHSVNSISLYQYLADHAASFNAIFFAPYLFGTTFWGSLIHPKNSYLIPCLHDEVYAYVDVIQSMFRQVSGCLFNAKPEMELARRLYGDVKGDEVGMGFVEHSPEYLSSLKPYFKDDFPYIVYIGRKETGKNVQLLIDYFIQAKNNQDLPEVVKLVIAGGGSFEDLHRPEALNRNDVLDIGRLSDEDKNRIIKYATALCQPSTNESFSIVLMEAWLLGTPVIVHSDSQVTRHHVIKSNGGLYFKNQQEFSSISKLLVNDKQLAQTMAESGYNYTIKEYSWDAVMQRFDQTVCQLLEDQFKQEDLGD